MKEDLELKERIEEYENLTLEENEGRRKMMVWWELTGWGGEQRGADQRRAKQRGAEHRREEYRL